MTNRRSMPAFTNSTNVRETLACLTDSSMQTSSATGPVLGNLQDDMVKALPDGTPTFLDRNLDARLGSLESGLADLQVSLTFDWEFSFLGIHEGNGIVISDEGEIRIDGTVIGIIPSYSTDYEFAVEFTANATPELVQRLIRALTFKSTPPDPDGISWELVNIRLTDQSGNHELVTVHVVVGPPSAQVLTTDDDSLTGTSGADTFVTGADHLSSGDQIAGGEGNDTLRLLYSGTYDLRQVAFTGIETIEGSEYADEIKISSDQLTGVNTINGAGGGYNDLYITGTQVDLTGKTLNGIKIYLETDNAVVTVHSKAIAKVVHGTVSQNDKLILTSEVLTSAERLALHRQGIETIVDRTGLSTTHTAPQIANLGGDHVSSTGNTPVLLDAGSNATLTDDDGRFSQLRISVTSRIDTSDILGIAAANGVTVDTSGYIAVNRTPIGYIDS
jgi:hypothetical protein